MTGCSGDNRTRISTHTDPSWSPASGKNLRGQEKHENSALSLFIGTYSEVWPSGMKSPWTTAANSISTTFLFPLCLPILKCRFGTVCTLDKWIFFVLQHFTTLDTHSGKVLGDFQTSNCETTAYSTWNESNRRNHQKLRNESKTGRFFMSAN